MKTLKLIYSLTLLLFAIISCSSGQKNNSNVIVKPKIFISTSSNTLKLGETALVTIYANESAAALSPSILLISTKNDTIVIDPNSSCELSSKFPKCDLLIGAEKLTPGTKIIAIASESSIEESSVVIKVIDNTTKYIFVSESSPSGDMYSNVYPYNDTNKYPNGVSRADAICQNNATENTSHLAWVKNPENYKWKAMLVDENNRIAAPISEQKDWVFSPNTTYKDAITGIIYGKTNTKSVFDDISGLIVQFGDLRNDAQSYWGNNGLAWSEFNHEIMFWTGMNGDSTTNYENNCNSWNSSNQEDYALFGIVSVYGNPFDPINRSEYFSSIFQYSFYQWNYIGHAAYCSATDIPNSIAVRLVCVQQ